MENPPLFNFLPLVSAEVIKQEEDSDLIMERPPFLNFFPLVSAEKIKQEEDSDLIMERPAFFNFIPLVSAEIIKHEVEEDTGLILEKPFFNFLPLVSAETTQEGSAEIHCSSYPNAPTTARIKRVHSTNPQEKRPWGCSTKLKLFDDPWKIKKVLKKSDVLGSMNRLLLPAGSVEELVFPVLKEDERRNAETGMGTKVGFWDVDTNTSHSLVLKRWVSSRSFVFIGEWHRDFVRRKNLKIGDEIGLQWDPYNYCFNFSVLQRASI